MYALDRPVEVAMAPIRIEGTAIIKQPAPPMKESILAWFAFLLESTRWK